MGIPRCFKVQISNPINPIFGLVGPKMILNVNLKDNVNTNLKQRMISVKYKLAQKKIKSQKVNQTQTKVFILVRSF